MPAIFPSFLEGTSQANKATVHKAIIYKARQVKLSQGKTSCGQGWSQLSR